MATLDITPKKEKTKRLVSLDALRGFDMFWIIGARPIANGLVGLKMPGASLMAAQLYHSSWHGFRFYDLIFPLFIYITGVSLVLSLKKRQERGESVGLIIRHVITRTVILFSLGILYNIDLHFWPWPASIRIMGVLQRIAICYFFTSLLILTTRIRSQVLVTAGVLAGYWALMRFVPVPGYGAGVWTEQGNLAHYVDSLLLPGRLYYGSWDPEGLLSTIPAVATCLLGALSGHWLRMEKWQGRVFNLTRHVQILFLAGIGLTAAGLYFNAFFPINKYLWSSSYVLLTGGLSSMLFAVFIWVIDGYGFKRWSFPFVAVGMNSIFIYLAVRFIPFDRLAYWMTGGDRGAILGRSQDLIIGLVELFIEGLILILLYHRRIFIRI